MQEFRRDARRALDAVRRGERFLLTYRGRPIARLEPVPATPVGRLEDDPLMRVDDFAVDGPGGRVSNAEMDRIVYGG